MDLKEFYEIMDLATEGIDKSPADTKEEELKLVAMLSKSISEEELAVAEYEKRVACCLEHGYEDLSKMFEELANDEKVHAAQLRKALEIYGLNNPEKEEEGQEEAQEQLEPIGNDENPELEEIIEF